jgi:hypothetical protein
MHSEYFFIDDSCNRQAVEAVCERLPQLDVVTTFAYIRGKEPDKNARKHVVTDPKRRNRRTFVIKAIDSIDTCTLVVTPQHKEVLRVLNFVGKQETYRLERLLTTVDIVSQEQVVRFWWEAAVLEQSEQIVILAVYVTYDQTTGCSTSSKSSTKLMADKKETYHIS